MVVHDLLRWLHVVVHVLLSVEALALVVCDQFRRLRLHDLILLLLGDVLRPVLRVIELARVLDQLRVVELRVCLHFSVDIEPEASFAILRGVVVVDINLKLIFCSVIQINRRRRFRLVRDLVVFGILT